MNLYLMIGVVAALLASHWFAYDIGKDVAEKQQLERKLVARAAADEVKDDIAGMGRTLAGEVHAAFKDIKVSNTTTVRNIYNEKEIHRVLTNPDCAWPVSTLRVRNDSRYDPDADYRARQRPDAGVRQPPIPADGKAAPSR